MLIGISYSEMLGLTLREINVIGEGYLKKREIDINQSLYIAHQSAILTSLAVWGSKDFPKQPPTVSFKSDKQIDGNGNSKDYQEGNDNKLEEIHQLARNLISGRSF